MKSLFTTAGLKLLKLIQFMLSIEIYFGQRVNRDLPQKSQYAIIIFPIQPLMLNCGLAGIVAFKKKENRQSTVELDHFFKKLSEMNPLHLSAFLEDEPSIDSRYLGGQSLVEDLMNLARDLKTDAPFYQIFINQSLQKELDELSQKLKALIESEQETVSQKLGHLKKSSVEVILSRLEILKDIKWCINTEILGNINKLKAFFPKQNQPKGFAHFTIFKKINAVLNSIDRLEVRGRDSCGISILFMLNASEFEKFQSQLTNTDSQFLTEFSERTQYDVLLNRNIHHKIQPGADGQQMASLAFTYKISAEIGKLGDNIEFIRQQIESDQLLTILTQMQIETYSIEAHTRWASIGEISESNCHPVDNITKNSTPTGSIHVALNGDIDNYQEIKEELANCNHVFPETITTDTKVIAVLVEKYFIETGDILRAFQKAVNRFEGSHAIFMHSDHVPGKLFLAQKGSGQSIFVGLANDHYISTSEVYGLVEETQNFIKLDGEKSIQTETGAVNGQIFVLNDHSAGGVDGIHATYYDGTDLELTEKDVQTTEITSRDIDRQDFPHYFLKEISEAPRSVEKTIQNRWVISPGSGQSEIDLDESVIPHYLKNAIRDKKIKRVFFIGQGTAGVAALASANIMSYYIVDPSIQIQSRESSELSGFSLSEDGSTDSMKDVLIIAVSQSGTTTDTNQALAMAKERGAYTLGIVNRRDSDLTFMVDGVFYTSSGRDVEMSVASTKAFYSQIMAGTILSLFIAQIMEARPPAFIHEEIQSYLMIPTHMRQVLLMKPDIQAVANKHALSKIYWATVGSGPNKASADEIRIKLSELCYKTISTDYVENKKHIDLSAEPLIIICAAGTKANVIGDIIKDTAIFKAHKAIPIVIADENEDRFDGYAEAVFKIPHLNQHLAPILNTLVGHIWGYYAALAINEVSHFLYTFRESVRNHIDRHNQEGGDIYELILEKTFREQMAEFYIEFRKRRQIGLLPPIMGYASELTLLLKYLSGRLPVSDFEMDFGIKGTAINMVDVLFEILNKAINTMYRPIDAIKHQAKTVTVGTSRIAEKFTGVLFDALQAYDFRVSQVINRNIVVLRNLQEIVQQVNGTLLYQIDGLNLLGEVTDDTKITVKSKDGILKGLSSRVEDDNRLRGTKKIIVRQGNVYIGKGRNDDQSIIIVPVVSATAAKVNIIEYLLLLNITFKQAVPLSKKIKALGGKYEHITNIVQENSLIWDDQYLELIAIDELFGRSAEKVSEFIVNKLK